MLDIYLSNHNISSYSESVMHPGHARHHSALLSARSQDRLHSTARLSTRSYSLGRARVLSDPSLTQRSPRHSSPRHVHSNSEVISRGPGSVSRGTIRPYSQDLSDLQESFERELYVNKRT